MTMYRKIYLKSWFSTSDFFAERPFFFVCIGWCDITWQVMPTKQKKPRFARKNPTMEELPLHWFNLVSYYFLIRYRLVAFFVLATYKHQEKFFINCNFCVCFDGNILCTKSQCLPGANNVTGVSYLHKYEVSLVLTRGVQSPVFQLRQVTA